MPSKASKFKFTHECDLCESVGLCRKYYIQPGFHYHLCKPCNRARFLIGINQFEENLLSMSDKRLFLQSEPVIDATSGTTSEHTNQETVEFI
jgi:hypothetical protein